VIGALSDRINDVAGGAEVVFLTGTDTAIQAGTVPGAVAISQTNYFIANDAGKTSIAHATTSSGTRTMPRAPAWAVQLGARGTLPARVADAVAAALTNSVAAAVVELLAGYHLFTVHASESEPAVGCVICTPDLRHLRQCVCVDVADLVQWPNGQTNDEKRKSATHAKAVPTTAS